MSRIPHAPAAILVLVAALALSLVGGPALASRAPAAAAQRAGSGPTEVIAPCSGGPGRLTIAVSAPNADGDHPVTLTGTRMVEGSRWRVSLEREDDGQPQRFRRTAVDGSWSVSTVLEGSDVEPVITAVASGRIDGERRFSCVDLVLLGRRVAAGLAACGSGLIALVARQRRDGVTALGAVLLRGRGPQRWNLEFRVAAGSTTQTVTVQDYSNRSGELVSRILFDGLAPDPRFRVRISNARGASCWIGLAPGALAGSSAADGDAGLAWRAGVEALRRRM